MEVTVTQTLPLWGLLADSPLMESAHDEMPADGAGEESEVESEMPALVAHECDEMAGVLSEPSPGDEPGLVPSDVDENGSAPSPSSVLSDSKAFAYRFESPECGNSGPARAELVEMCLGLMQFLSQHHPEIMRQPACEVRNFVVV